MASAVLASRNETSWAGHMGKIPYSNHHHLNANPNPNPKKQKKFHNAVGNDVAGRFHNVADSPVITQTASDDAYSFNQTSTSRNAANYGGYLTFNVASYSKSELVELRKRLSAELEQIRDLQDRIESGQFSSTGHPRSSAKIKKPFGNKKPIAAFDSAPNRPINNGLDNRYLDAVNFEAMLKDCKQVLGKLMKHKFAYVFRTPVDAVALGLHDYHSIVKIPMDLGTVRAKLAKNSYPSPVEFAADVRLTFNNALLYNPKNDPVNSMADQMLGRFEELFRPIQEKIKSCVNQQSEWEFQEFRTNDRIQFQGNEEFQGNLWNNHNRSLVSSPRGKVKQKPSLVQAPQVPKKVERMQMPMQAHSTASTPSHPPLPPMNQNHQSVQEQIHSHVRAPNSSLMNQDHHQKAGRVKQPKPKAKDEVKREMSMDEKQKLGIGLQNLPQEKMPQLVQIIRKRNDDLAQDGDEIELDIETLDTETLWELDRFVMNWKKFMSKSKRQGPVVNDESAATGVDAPSTPTPDADKVVLSDKNGDLVKKLSKDEDEDVDIDDDMPATSFPPVEIEKDEGVVNGGANVHGHDRGDQRGNASSSSNSSGSSSSDSSSSSGIDSDPCSVSTMCSGIYCFELGISDEWQ
ncbi:transcription factor gte2 [Phtheirospermum japonicum]|uniref:Transcription factor gte2 n=1 Tax=Phtheirospermum japonicum TaxID=374723 RepID=A0A830CJF9_9LAMI|nr:transcription factor gte2 [Phtheirospermum japonicum]